MVGAGRRVALGHTDLAAQGAFGVLALGDASGLRQDRILAYWLKIIEAVEVFVNFGLELPILWLFEKTLDDLFVAPGDLVLDRQELVDSEYVSQQHLSVDASAFDGERQLIVDLEAPVFELIFRVGGKIEQFLL